jgi:hypothetical protein
MVCRLMCDRVIAGVNVPIEEDEEDGDGGGGGGVVVREID